MDEKQTYVLGEATENTPKNRTHVLSKLTGETFEREARKPSCGSRQVCARFPIELASELSQRANASDMGRCEYLRRILSLGLKVSDGSLPMLYSDSYQMQIEVPFDPSGDVSNGAASFKLRVDESDYERLSKLAESMKTSVAGALRALARVPVVFRLGYRGTSNDASQIQIITDSALCELSYQLNKIGVNYNQIARALNVLARGELDPEGDERESRETALAILRAAARANEGVCAELAKLMKQENLLYDLHLHPEPQDRLVRHLGPRKGGD